MPIYEYHCQDCQTIFEAIRGMSEADDPIHCVKCSSENVKRKLSLFNAASNGRVIAGSSSCSSCSGGSCSTCGSH